MRKIPTIKDIYFYLSGMIVEIGLGIFILLIGLVITWLIGRR